ncbi:hypothetical protein [Nitrosomonas sp.]|uniref:hypothetical protein n=1 Tax=Nitrosomonas sp. TaxID=42353 RepID=UPI00272FA671|nr:hypothetical protein [Nitrosomonas sp.]MDP1786231.1 hypothetical protein [Nitrosomonas sp.]MDP2225220.1 hypothetical protein [Nitrosomonas sp.]
MGQNTRTHSDHNNLSNYYDNLAKEVVAKAAELLQRDYEKSTEMPDQQNNRKIKARLNSGSGDLLGEATEIQ